ncbi:hypothetical protein G7Y89_g10914 [Cudoniella acicularis]|uniref:Uncharacterized protein n=1 Tax=Cudoniella acicularis TaxID=354080 RepID=A0A8H4RBU2_9HELO|nr:hypothetical protein G7Y89_g10914 [Cudoniella acicularis]
MAQPLSHRRWSTESTPHKAVSGEQFKPLPVAHRGQSVNSRSPYRHKQIMPQFRGITDREAATLRYLNEGQDASISFWRQWRNERFQDIAVGQVSEIFNENRLNSLVTPSRVTFSEPPVSGTEAGYDSDIEVDSPQNFARRKSFFRLPNVGPVRWVRGGLQRRASTSSVRQSDQSQSSSGTITPNSTSSDEQTFKGFFVGKISSVRARIQQVLDPSRGKEQEVELTELFSDRFTLDLPPESSQDKSELDYLRRAQMQEAAVAALNRMVAQDANLATALAQGITEVLRRNITTSENASSNQTTVANQDIANQLAIAANAIATRSTNLPTGTAAITTDVDIDENIETHQGSIRVRTTRIRFKEPLVDNEDEMETRGRRRSVSGSRSPRGRSILKWRREESAQRPEELEQPAEIEHPEKVQQPEEVQETEEVQEPGRVERSEEVELPEYPEEGECPDEVEYPEELQQLEEFEPKEEGPPRHVFGEYCPICEEGGGHVVEPRTLSYRDAFL